MRKGKVMQSRLLGLLAIGAASLLLAGCKGGDQKHELERKYDQLKVDMTADEVTGIMGEGKPVTATELAEYPEYGQLDLTDLPKDIRWVRWGDGHPYVLAGFSKDILVLAAIKGVGPPKREGQ
jgi:uncharacterized lipoprotein YajG